MDLTDREQHIVNAADKSLRGARLFSAMVWFATIVGTFGGLVALVTGFIRMDIVRITIGLLVVTVFVQFFMHEVTRKDMYSIILKFKTKLAE